MLRSMEGTVPAEQIERMRENNARFLEQTEAVLRQAQARLPDAEAMRSEAAEHAGSRLTRLRGALAALRSDERGAPACVDANEPLTGTGSCTDFNRIVTLNPRYFDPSLPKGAVQLLVVSTSDGTSDKENRDHAALRFRIFETLDYAALAALLR